MITEKPSTSWTFSIICGSGKSAPACCFLHIENISQHHAVVRFVLGAQGVIGQRVGYLYPVAQTVIDGKLQHQVKGIEKEVADLIRPWNGDAQHGQELIAVANQRSAQRGGIIPPQAQIHAEQAETVVPHHLPALPQGGHGALARPVDEDILGHPVLVGNRNGEDAVDQAENRHHRSHGGHQLQICGIVQQQGRIHDPGLAYNGQQKIHGRFGQGRQHVNKGGRIHAGKADAKENQSLDQHQPQQGPKPVKAQPQGLGGHILPPGNAQHGGHVSQVDAQNHHDSCHGQQGLHRGKDTAQAHIAKAAGLGNLQLQQIVDQGHQNAQAQNQAGVNQDNALAALGLLHPLGGKGLQFFRVSDIHSFSPIIYYYCYIPIQPK